MYYYIVTVTFGTSLFMFYANVHISNNSTLSLQNVTTDQGLCSVIKKPNVDGLVQERGNSSALAMELRLSCINQLTWTKQVMQLPTWVTLKINGFVYSMTDS